MKNSHGFIKRCAIVTTLAIALSALSFCFSAFALNINKNELSIYEKSDGVIINSTDDVEINNTIAPDITFSQLNDYITYKFTLSNDDNSLYHITSVTDNNTNTNITTSYSYDDTTSTNNKDIYITLTYANELTSEPSLTNYEVAVNYEEIAPTDDDNEEKPTDSTDDADDIPVPNTSGQTNNNSPKGSNNTTSPDTGSHTISKTFSTNAPAQNNIIPIALSTFIICIAGGMLYYVLRKHYRYTNFDLTKFSHSRQALRTTIGSAVLGLVITGGVISITHAIDSSSLVLSFDLSKVQIIAYPTGTRTVEFNANSSNAIIDATDATSTCDLYFDRTTCEVTIPNFTTTSGYEALGWSTDANAHEALYHPGDTVPISVDTSLYTITRKSLLATFVNQHTTYFTVNKDSDSCYIYNNETSCQIATPTASKISTTSGSEFLGWSTSPNSLSPSVSAGATLDISETTALYSVASIPATTISIHFVNNDPSGVTNISETTKSCTMIDEESSCTITIPDFTVASGYTKIGWNSSSNANLAEYLPGQEVSFRASATFYTISKTTLTASFTNQHTDYFTTSASSVSCDAYNGAASCDATTPTATATALGQAKEAAFLGWSASSGASSASYSAGESISITNSTSLYSVIYIPPTYHSYEVYFVNQDPTGISQISQSSTTCTLPETETNCSITLPTISASSGYETLGWSTDSSSTSATYSAGSTVTVSENTTFYTVSRAPLTATFTNLHSEYFSISASSASCYLYNGSTSGCAVSTPAVTKLTNDPNTTLLGWNTDSTTQSGMESENSITIYSDSTYYSIAKIPTDTTYSLRFMNNNMSDSEIPSSYFSSANDCLNYSGDYCTMVEKSCTVYTWEASCAIKAPDFNTAPGWDAYGHDTKYSGSIFSETDLSNDFKSIGEDITVTAVNNGNGYNTIIKNHNPTTATFVNQHTKYHIVSSANNASCYIFNNNGTCSVSAPNLTQEGNYNNITKLVWSTKPSAYSNEIVPTETVDISEDSTFYSAASGIAYTITFDKNTDYTWPNYSGVWGTQANIAAESLSFYQAQCNITSSGCYLSNTPRIYSTGNTPIGFNLSQHSNFYTTSINPLNYNFVADTTLYARVFNWSDVSASYTTRKISHSENDPEYFQVDFENTINENLISEYGDYLEYVFSQGPQLYALHGKMRFLARTTFHNYHPDYPTSLMLTQTYLGLYASIDASPSSLNATDDYTKFALVHELGHALDAAWKDLYGTELSQQPNIKGLYNQYKSMYDEYVATHGSFSPNNTIPLRDYSYTNETEFFAEAFAAWFARRSNITLPTALSYDLHEIPETLYGYLCNASYDKIPYINSAPICNAPNN